MKKIIKYVAVDGTEFDYEAECITYEINLNKPDNKSLILVGDDLNLLPISPDGLDDSYYMEIKDDIALKWIANVSEEYGFNSPNKKGRFYYDVRLNKWKNADRIVDMAKKLMKIFNFDKGV